ncbi:MAG TPA: potassium-transporting ATPase subunit KdpA, partial [Anaeromyxobacteraceae bacterium]|nr:potassium-transporting ATPase subunit KdpA [Anaeromyxobacteraceae bacterium]
MVDQKVEEQAVAQGPVASQIAIKMLGTNGGGFFNANGAHPFENPTPLTNFVGMLAIAVLPASLTQVLGRMTGRPRQGWMLFGVMVAFFVVGLTICGAAEQAGNPRLAALGVSGPNLEGKEVRFGVAQSVLAAVTTSNGATGSTAATPDSFTPLGVSVPLVNMLLGEIVFGGLGTGIQGMVVVALIAMFIGSLMIGRTPQYLGKTLGPPEMKLVVLYALAAPLAVLLLTALAVATEAGRAALTTNEGPHGLTEILFAYASSAGNNGQTMAGLSANSVFWNVTTAAAMVLGRFGLVVPALALAGRMAVQRPRPESSGTLPSDTLLFGVLLGGSAVLLGALTFLPALALGPVVEHLQLVRRS